MKEKHQLVSEINKLIIDFKLDYEFDQEDKISSIKSKLNEMKS